MAEQAGEAAARTVRSRRSKTGGKTSCDQRNVLHGSLTSIIQYSGTPEPRTLSVDQVVAGPGRRCPPARCHAGAGVHPAGVHPLPLCSCGRCVTRAPVPTRQPFPCMPPPTQRLTRHIADREPQGVRRQPPRPGGRQRRFREARIPGSAMANVSLAHRHVTRWRRPCVRR
jgi:hypothetical protein